MKGDYMYPGEDYLSYEEPGPTPVKYKNKKPGMATFTVLIESKTKEQALNIINTIDNLFDFDVIYLWSPSKWKFYKNETIKIYNNYGYTSMGMKDLKQKICKLLNLNHKQVIEVEAL